MKDPNIWFLNEVIKSSQQNAVEIVPGTWVPARPLGFSSWSFRIKAAWLVFTGKADALIWPGNQ